MDTDLLWLFDCVTQITMVDHQILTSTSAIIFSPSDLLGTHFCCFVFWEPHGDLVIMEFALYRTVL